MMAHAFAVLMLASLLSIVEQTACANLLFLSPHTSYSHTNFFLPVIKELAHRNHTITFWNGLKPRSEIERVTQLSSEQLHHFNTNHKIGFESNNPFLLLISLPDRLTQICNVVYSDPSFEYLIFLKNTTTFDLIVIEGFMNECMLPLVPYFNAPFIYLTALPPLPWMLDMTDSPMSFDHFPCLTTDYTNQMSLFQRSGNTIMGLVMVHFRHWFILPAVDRVAAQLPIKKVLSPVRQVENNLSLLISNTLTGLSYSYPKSSAIIDAGGLHFEPSKPLPKVNSSSHLKTDGNSFMRVVFL